MEPIDFVRGIRKSIVNDGLQVYHDILNNTSQSEATDPYWIEVLQFFLSLNEVQQLLLLKLIRQIEVDTVSSIFAVLDGIAKIDNQSEEIHLTLNDSTQLSGDLQDIFLELEEFENRT